MILYFINRLLEPAIKAQKHELAHASKHVVAALTSIDLVKVYNGEVHELWQYQQSISRAARHYLRQAVCNCAQLGYIKLWMNSVFMIGFYYAVILVEQGGLTAGKALTTFWAALTAFQALESIGPHWLTLAKGLAAGKALAELVEEVTSSTRSHEEFGYRPLRCDGDVELKEVSFAYPSNPAQLVVSPVSMFFPAGEVTYLVGKSGSGKSTIGNLLVRFYEPSSGTINLDGVPLAHLDMSWVRNNITLVQQSSVLFSDTLANNVGLGAREPGRVNYPDIQMACGIALLQSTISGLPKGLDTDVGPGAHNLSGGQKQRVAIARARLRDPPVLILDEVTSGLDPANRGLIMDAIRLWRKGKTTIIITHEVHQIKESEYVYVMDRGHLVQEGYRKGLEEAKGGLFASLLASADMEAEQASNAGDQEGETDFESSDDDAKLVQHAGQNGVGVALQSPQAARVYESRFSKYFQGINNGNDSKNPQGMSRMALGGATNMALRMRTKQLWEQPLTPLTSSFNIIGEEGEEEGDVQFPAQSHARQDKETFELKEPSDPFDSWYGTRGSLEIIRSSSRAVRNSRQAAPTTTRERRITLQPETTPPTVSMLPHHGIQRMDSMHLFMEQHLAKKRSRRGIAAKVGEEAATSQDKFTTPPLSAVLRTIWPTTDRNHQIQLVFGVLLCIVVAACNPAFSLIFANLASSFWAQGDQESEAKRWGIYLLVIAVLEGASVFLTYLLFERVGQAWVNSLRREALSRILSQPKSWFDKPNHSPSRISQTLDWSAEEMRKIVSVFLPIMLIVTVMVSSSLIWAMAIRWDLTFVALTGLPIAIGGTRMNSKVSDKWENICITAADKSASIFTEAFSNIRVVRALTLERHFTRKHDKSVDEAYGLNKRRAMYQGFWFGLYQAIPYFIVALTIWYAARLVVLDKLTLANELRVINLVVLAINNALHMLSNIPQLAAAKTTALQMLYYAHLPHDAGHEHQGTEPIRSPLPVRMSRLRFAYPGRESSPVLHNLSLKIETGTCTAIVGASGCGKSTIAALLLRLYEPESAAQSTPTSSPSSVYFHHLHPKHASRQFRYPLTFAGRPANTLCTTSLRSHCALVPQHPFLFPGTIRQNITYGLPETSPFLITYQSAAISAGIHEFIASLPEGYNTLVGDGGGISLSGGQMQRIAIARALVRRPDLLVLDEPTSSLDAEAAEGIRSVITRLVKEEGGRMAVVVVTHSKEMMKIAHVIAVVEDGAVAESGTWDELRGGGEAFARLVGGVMGSMRMKKKTKGRRVKERRVKKEGGDSDEGEEEEEGKSPRWLRDSWKMNQEALRRLEGGIWED